MAAQLFRGYPFAKLATLEESWAAARDQAAVQGTLEHGHWDWRNKASSAAAGQHVLVAVECEGEPQGIMAVFRSPRPAKLGTGQVLYVDYLESAPWNLKGFSAPPRFIGVGTVLIVEAIRLSHEAGHRGCVGLHSLPAAEPFYGKCQMTKIGEDPDYYDLVYFEYTEQQAASWLGSIGESL